MGAQGKPRRWGTHETMGTTSVELVNRSDKKPGTGVKKGVGDMTII
jgi:hypothetical protein